MNTNMKTYYIPGRVEDERGPKFRTNIKEVPDETREQFYAPQVKTTEGRREKYGLNRSFRTPSHVRQTNYNNY